MSKVTVAKSAGFCFGVDRAVKMVYGELEQNTPRCCKRDSYLAIVKAVEFAREHLGVEMELGKIKCVHSKQNNQCIGKRCPFWGK